MMKMKVVRYLSIAVLASPLLLSGCGDNDGVPIPTPGPVGPTSTPVPPAPTRTPTRAAATATATVPSGPTATATQPVATATATATLPAPTATATTDAATATPTADAASPTPTATSVEATATPTVPAGGPGIQMSTVSTAPGQQVVVSATLATGGGSVAGTQNDFAYATAENRKVLVVRKTNNRPDCTVNPDISKGSTTFAFQPAGCAADACTAVRAIVFSSEDVEPIADGAVLYTCKVDVAADASGTNPLTLSGTILSNPTGGRVCGPASGNPPCTGNVDGAIIVN